VTVPRPPVMPDDVEALFHALSNGAIIIGCIGCLIFVIFYHRLTRWRETALGRNVMAFMACMIMLVGLGFVRAFLDVWIDSWIELLRFVAFTITATVVWNRVYLLIRYQTAEAEEARRNLRDERADAHEKLAEARDARADERERRADDRDRRAGTPPEGVSTRE
jgi:uncharacterized membrane protein YjfL (UPF0719 family)